MQDASQVFDAAAVQYDCQLQQGISLSGESADYFVRGRTALLAELLRERGMNHGCGAVLDFGCGIGNAATELVARLHTERLVGLDCSAHSIQVARQRYPTATWLTDSDLLEPESFDVVYTSGVFHHIPPGERPAILSSIHRWVRPGGYFAFFENNPWNPGTRWVMSRIPFDRDASCLSITQANRLLTAAGFHIAENASLFYFPKVLAWLRPVERWLRRVPAGAQYLVLAQRPARRGGPAETGGPHSHTAIREGTEG